MNFHPLKRLVSSSRMFFAGAIALVTFTAAGAQAPGTNQNGILDFSAFEVISQHNIFDPERRPPVTNHITAAPVVDSFALTGTMNYYTNVMAVFDGNKPDYHRLVRPVPPSPGTRSQPFRTIL